MADVLSQLLGASWRGVPFPIGDWVTELSHDQHEHKWPGRDGEHVEATGRNGQIHTVEIPFRNGIYAARTERWPSRALYPGPFRAFYAAAVDGSTGELIHPELGRLRCKLRSKRMHWAADRRDGVDVSCVWIESDDEGDTLEDVLSDKSPVAEATRAARDLDALVHQIPEYERPKGQATFEDMMRSMQAAFDTPTRLSKQLGGAIDNISMSLIRVGEAVERQRSTSLWPIKQAIDRFRNAVIDLKKALLSERAILREYRVPADTTLAALSQFLAVPLDALVRLNPLLIEDPRVSAGTRVRYPKK